MVEIQTIDRKRYGDSLIFDDRFRRLLSETDWAALPKNVQTRFL